MDNGLIPDNFEYESPIDLVTNRMSQMINYQVEEGVVKAVCNLGISIDKKQLVSALQNDRSRYEEAYSRGYGKAASTMYTASQVAAIINEIVGDECACNVNGNDEWLPCHCDYCKDDYEGDVRCPDGNCWEQYLKYRHLKGEKDV